MSFRAAPRAALPGSAALLVLLFLLDQLYRLLHPEVNLVRATLVGATAFAALWLAARAGSRLVPPAPGALAVLASACSSVLLIEAGWLVSRSSRSAVFHAVVVVAAYALLRRVRSPALRLRAASTCRSPRW
jgi:hypothetical protein